ncbi:hypothetical protein JN853_06555 [Pseudomonas syringae pv. actinidiae ICMP 9853]|nr:hypothetical protein JN853_06555 [Pseudomonas syringae pv. actinidiae ICMP 9853]
MQQGKYTRPDQPQQHHAWPKSERKMNLRQLRAGIVPECVKTRQNVVGAQRLLSVVGYLAPKSFWLSYGGPD